MVPDWVHIGVTKKRGRSLAESAFGVGGPDVHMYRNIMRIPEDLLCTAVLEDVR